MKCFRNIGFLTSLLFSSSAFAGETLATCTVKTLNGQFEVEIEKWTGPVPTEEQHLTMLLERSGDFFEFVEMLDGSGRVGFGHATVENNPPNRAYQYNWWTLGKLPMSHSYMKDGTYISCK